MASREIVRLRNHEPCRMMAKCRAHPQPTLLLAPFLLAIASCAPAPRPNPPAFASTRPAQQSAPAPPVTPAAASSNSVSPANPDEKPLVFNDPPASPDTPLCGRQAQESNAIGATLQGASVASSGICARFACYDPLTATYIGADGYRHVCR